MSILAGALLSSCNIQGSGSKTDSNFLPGLNNPNVAPVASNSSLTTNTNTLVASTLLGTDANSTDTLTFSVVTSPTKGVLVITNSSTGAFTYTPNNGEAGADSFTFKINDGKIDSNTATVSITIGTVAFLDSWPFDALSTALYTFNATFLQFTAGVAELIGTDQIDDDNTASGFAGGTLTGVAWDGTKLKLDASGTPTNNSELDASWTPQWASVVGYWKLNEGAGSPTVSDSSGQGNTGTVLGGVTLGAAGKMLQSAQLDGTSGYIQVSDAPSLRPTTDLTIMAWVKPVSITACCKLIVNKWQLSSDYWFNFIAGNLQVQFDSQNYAVAAPSQILDGNFHQVVAVADSANSLMKIYMDGILLGSAAFNGTITAGGGPLVIGHNLDAGVGNQHFDGSIDEVALWSTALTTSEIQSIYNRQSPKYAGTFTSRVMNALSSSSWTTLSWLPTLPFFKELPDYASGAIQNEVSTQYTSLVGSTGSTGANDLMSGIVGLWHMNESSWADVAAEVTDDSGQANHGRAKNGAAISAYGKFGKGGSLDGADDYIDCGTNASLNIPGNLSISAWINNFDISQSFRMIVTKSNDTPNINYEFRMGFAGTLSLLANFGAGAVYTGVNSSTVIQNNTWYHVAATYDGATAKIYLNGVLDGQNALTGALATTAQACNIGARQNGAYTFPGQIDEVAIWNRALHANEIKQLYQRGASRLKYQVRTCNDNACAGESWQGPDGTSATYFSELNNNTAALAMTGDVKTTLPSMLFSAFTSPPGANQYFQYRTIFETDSTSIADGPELKSVTVDPIHYPAYLSTDTTPGTTIIGNNGISFIDLNAYTQSLGAGGCSTGVVYNIGLSNTGPWKYWTGATWATADGSSGQANAATVINTNIAAFGTQFGTGSVFFKAFLQSSGTSKCELDNIQVGGNR